MILSNISVRYLSMFYIHHFIYDIYCVPSAKRNLCGYDLMEQRKKFQGDRIRIDNHCYIYERSYISFMITLMQNDPPIR